jgi:hypothetical protein
MLKPIFLTLALAFALSVPATQGVALTPAPPDATEPTMDDVWARSPIIVYGRIVALEVAPAKEDQSTYLAYFQVERVWKGVVKPKDELTIQETLPDGAGKGYALEFNRTYILQATQREGGKRYTRNGSQAVVLPIPRSTGNALSPVLGGDPGGSFLAWVEFLERKGGNVAEADRIRKLRGQDVLDRETNFSKEKIFADQAVAEFRKAMEETGIVERAALLEPLLKRIQYNTQEDMVVLTGKIKAELSLGATFLSAGRTTFPE